MAEKDGFQSMQVLYYLVRIEPYSTLAIQLQGGKFDHADRMFSDIASTWNGVCEDMSDVKELVIVAFSNFFGNLPVRSLCT
jgi:hypothetical protein